MSEIGKLIEEVRGKKDPTKKPLQPGRSRMSDMQEAAKERDRILRLTLQKFLGKK